MEKSHQNLVETLNRLSEKYGWETIARENSSKAIRDLKNKNPGDYKQLFKDTPPKKLKMDFKNAAFVYKSKYFDSPYVETTYEIYSDPDHIRCGYSLVADLGGAIIDDYLIY